jgi:hypothetical protein
LDLRSNDSTRVVGGIGDDNLSQRCRHFDNRTVGRRGVATSVSSMLTMTASGRTIDGRNW